MIEKSIDSLERRCRLGWFFLCIGTLSLCCSWVAFAQNTTVSEAVRTRMLDVAEPQSAARIRFATRPGPDASDNFGSDQVQLGLTDGRQAVSIHADGRSANCFAHFSSGFDSAVGVRVLVDTNDVAEIKTRDIGQPIWSTWAPMTKQELKRAVQKRKQEKQTERRRPGRGD